NSVALYPVQLRRRRCTASHINTVRSPSFKGNPIIGNIHCTVCILAMNAIMCTTGANGSKYIIGNSQLSCIPGLYMFAALTGDRIHGDEIVICPVVAYAVPVYTSSAVFDNMIRSHIISAYERQCSGEYANFLDVGGSGGHNKPAVDDGIVRGCSQKFNSLM